MEKKREKNDKNNRKKGNKRYVMERRNDMRRKIDQNLGP